MTIPYLNVGPALGFQLMRLDSDAYDQARKSAVKKIHAGRDPEQYREAGRRGGAARVASMTPDELKEFSRLGGEAARGKRRNDG